MFTGTMARRWPATGNIESVPERTSWDRAPMADPSCRPKTVPPMFCSIGPSPPNMPRISSGTWSGSCSLRARLMASAMATATGSVMARQLSMVASTHSARDQATPRIPGDSISVTPSSHSSARRSASSISRRAKVPTEGSCPALA